MSGNERLLIFHESLLIVRREASRTDGQDGKRKDNGFMFGIPASDNGSPASYDELVRNLVNIKKLLGKVLNQAKTIYDDAEHHH